MRALLLAAMLLAPLGLAQEPLPQPSWVQPGGDAARSAVASFGGITFDVLASYPIAHFGTPFHRDDTMGLVATRHGLAGVGAEVEGDFLVRSCWIFLVHDLETGAATRTEPEPCRPDDLDQDVTTETGSVLALRIGLHAYDPARDAVVMGLRSEGDEPILRLRALPDGRDLWALRPVDLGGVPATAPVVDRGSWYPTGVAIEEATGTLFMGVHAPSRQENLLAAIDLATGTPRWWRTLDTLPALVGAGDGVLPPTTGFAPASVTVTAAGIVLLGTSHAYAVGSGGLLWFDREGALVGALDAQSSQPILHDEPPSSRSAGDYFERSSRVTASGRLAAVGLGTRAFVLDTTSPDPAAHAPLGIAPSSLPGASSGINPWAPPAWWLDTLLLPVQRELRAFEAPALEHRWTWSDSVTTSLSDLVLVPPGDAYVLAARNTTNPGDVPEVVLARVALADGRTIQRVPLPIAPIFLPELGPPQARPATPQWPGRLLPLPEQGLLVVWADQGDMVVLGQAAESLLPALALSDAYPAPGTPVTLAPRPPDGLAVSRYVVAWGDDTIETLGPGDEGVHQYASDGAHTILVTAIFDDGRTATARQLVHVGATPPLALTPLQRAVAPENYDLTFGLLGILIALVGGLLALLGRRRHRDRLARELKALEEAYAATKERPLACEAALAERKARARGLLLDHRLDGSQFAVLDRRIDELAGALRLSAIDERFPFLPVGMARTLREMLADGRVQRWEREHFLAALARDGYLTAEQKANVERQVEEWFARDADAKA